MKGQFLKDETWSIVQGTKKTPTKKSGELDEAFESHLEAFNDLNDSAMGQILTHVSEGPFTMVRDKNTATDMWKELKKVYMLKGYSARHLVWNWLMKSDLKQYKSLTDYGEDMKKGMKELSQLTGAPYHEWQITSTFLHGLGTEWQTVVDSIIFSIQEQVTLASKTPGNALTSFEPTFDEVFKRVLNYERQQKIDNGQGNGNKALAMGQNQSQKKKRDPSKKCHHCQQTGHLKNTCYFKHPDKAPAGWKDKTKEKEKQEKTTSNKALMTTPAMVRGNGWYMDSGACYHMCWNQDLFTTYDSVNRTINVADGRTQKCIGVGTVAVRIRNPDGTTEMVDIKEVWHVPSLQDNLLSLGTIEAWGLKVVMEEGRCTVSQGDDIIVTGTWVRDSRLYVLDEANPTAMAITHKGTSLLTWHRRLGHLGIDAVADLPSKVDGMQISKSSGRHPHCEPCVLGKQHRTPSRTLMTWATAKLGLIHIDLAGGGNQTPSLGGAIYYFIITWLAYPST